jgi:hypothetical protein
MKCPRCGASITSDAPEDFCLLCLITEGAALRRRASVPAPPPTTCFGDYQVLGAIARSGMGRVYLSPSKVVQEKLFDGCYLVSANVTVKQFKAI